MTEPLADAEVAAEAAAGERSAPGLVEPPGERPEAGWPAVLLVHGADAPSGWQAAQSTRVVALGAAVRCHAVNAGDADRDVLAGLEASARELGAREGVDAERLAVVGFGAGVPLAFLFACRSTRAAAAALVHGPLVYPQLEARRPSQPLELALNLGCPVLGVFGTGDPELPELHADRFEAVLSQFAKPFDIVRLPGVGARFYETSQGGEQAAQRELATFLQTYLELD